MTIENTRTLNMIERTLTMHEEQMARARVAWREILEWAHEDKMTASEWKGFVRYLIDSAGEHDSRVAFTSDGHAYRTHCWVVETGPGRKPLATRYESAMAASDAFESLRERENA